MREESLTRKFAAELLAIRNGQKDHPIPKAKKSQKPNSESEIENPEKRFHRIINFGARFYSIAEASIVSGIGETFIRKWINDGRLKLLTFPAGKQHKISGIELTELIVQHNLNLAKMNGKH